MEIRFGHLYLANLNPQKGTESGKIRPVLVIQTDLLNESGHPSSVILPCTTNCTGESLIRVFIPQGIAKIEKDCELMVDQIRAIDNIRFKVLLGKLPAPFFKECKEKLKHLFEHS